MKEWEKNGAFSKVTTIEYQGMECVKKELKEEKFTKNNLARFQREYDVLKSIHHPNVIQVLEIDGASYIMEKADCDLEEYILNNELTNEQIDHIVDGIVSGLACLHEHKDRIIHRDLKPKNILMINGVPKISDLGVCKPLLNNYINTSAYSQELMGSMRYMSDRHKEGKEEPDFHYDIFALGRVIYFMEKKEQPPIGAITNYEGMRYHALVLLTEQQNPIELQSIDEFIKKRLSMSSTKLSQADSILLFIAGQIGMTELVASFSQRRSHRMFEHINENAKDIIDHIAPNDDQSLVLFFEIYMSLFKSYRNQPYWDFKISTSVTGRLLELFEKANGVELRRKLFLASYEWSYDADQYGAMIKMDSYMRRKRKTNDFDHFFTEIVGYLEVSNMLRIQLFVEKNG